MTDIALRLDGPSPTLRWTAATFALLIVFVFAGGWIARTEIVARGQGRVVPVGAVRIIQSQIDGVVTQLLVENGEIVTKGDPILRLDNTTQRAELADIEDKIAEQTSIKVRAQATLHAFETVDPASPAFIKTAVNRLDGHADQTRLETELAALAATVAQNDAEMNTMIAGLAAIRSRIESTSARLKIETKILSGAERLLDKATISQVQFARAQQTVEQLRQENGVASGEFREREARIEAQRASRRTIIATARQDWRTRLQDAERSLNELNTRRTVAKQKLAFTVITAPSHGKVEDLKVRTLGAYLAPGDIVAKIVPVDDPVEVEVVIPSMDAGFLAIGQKAYIRLDAYPPERYALTHGRVRDIAAEPAETITRSSGVLIRIELDNPVLSLKTGPVPLVNGMTLSADIVTGDRPILAYFFEPIYRTLQQGHSER